MATAQDEINAYRVLHNRPEPESVPVILDEGDRASVAVVTLPHHPALGMRFEFGGILWEIARAKDHTRGWVACPLAERRAAS